MIYEAPEEYLFVEVDGRMERWHLGWRAFSAVVRHELEQIVTEAKRKPTYEDVYARYRRAHGQNPKITLKQVCAEMNVNYGSIRAMKSRIAKQKKRKRS